MDESDGDIPASAPAAEWLLRWIAGNAGEAVVDEIAGGNGGKEKKRQEGIA